MTLAMALGVFSMAAWGSSLVLGALALRGAHTTNRLQRPVGWSTLLLEPGAFVSKSASRRRQALMAAALFLALVCVQVFVALAPTFAR
jgi:hypothetical protein